MERRGWDVVTRSPVSLMPDIEALVISKINELDIVATYDKIPPTPPSEFCILNSDGGGVLHRLRWYQPNVHFDVYASSKGRARMLAQLIRQAMIESEGSRWTHTEMGDITAYISHVSDAVNIQWAPDPLEQHIYSRYIFGLTFTCRQ